MLFTAYLFIYIFVIKSKDIELETVFTAPPFIKTSINKNQEPKANIQKTCIVE